MNTFENQAKLQALNDCLMTAIKLVPISSTQLAKVDFKTLKEIVQKIEPLVIELENNV